jgi:prepilin-type N-terminal cleavage/methylation domain-containing protein
MCRKINGFTLVELLVTLVLMALIAATVVPQIDRWLGARERAAIRSEIASKLAMLPLQASRAGETLEITHFNQLDLPHNNIFITQPVTVLASGFCVGGTFTFTLTQATVTYNVTAPLCAVEENNESG